MKKIVPFLLASLLVFIIQPLQPLAAVLDDVKEIVDSAYVGEIDGDLKDAKTIDDVVEMLDPYSAYFTAEEYKAFMNSVDLKSVGIGVVIEKHKNGILITEVLANGSAVKNGIEAGDIITSIDGKSTVNMSIEEAQSLMLGKENTRVEIEILKENGSSATKLITRQTFSLPNSTSELLYGNVGYISLNSFSEDGARLVKNAYTRLQKEGATSFILDLQYNGGGYVTTAEELIGLFPNSPLAYKIMDSSRTETVRSTLQPVTFPQDTKVLVNRYSASASEMTAAALLDQQSAILYGETTYGKGTMQGFYELEDGSVLKLTVGEFFGPKGTVVRETGVKPHIVTKNNPIYQAHFDSIKANLSGYKELSMMENVPTNKTFKVTFSNSLAENINQKNVELVELGGNTVTTTLEVKGKQLLVQPTAPLKNGVEYLLIFHPTIKDASNKTLKTGKYLRITVEN